MAAASVASVTALALQLVRAFRRSSRLEAENARLKGLVDSAEENVRRRLADKDEHLARMLSEKDAACARILEEREKFFGENFLAGASLNARSGFERGRETGKISRHIADRLDVSMNRHAHPAVFKLGFDSGVLKQFHLLGERFERRI